MAATIAIAGAGISGLTLALRLHAAGHRAVTIYESAAELRELGVGINLQPRAVLILRDLGVFEALRSAAISTRETAFFDQYGNHIISEPKGVALGYKIPQLSVHRGQLQMILHSAVQERLGRDAVVLDHALESFAQTDDEVVMTFVSKHRSERRPRTARAHLLVGADGINSTTRRLMYPAEGPPRFSGQMLWRGSFEGSSFLSGASIMMAGHADKCFLAYPISNDTASAHTQRINWMCRKRVRPVGADPTPPAKTSWLLEAEREPLLREFGSWSFGFLSVPDVIHATDTIWAFPMSDRDPVPSWTTGRVTLMGDAAHPMYPYGGNGATQSIIDADCLVRCLDEAAGVTAALQAYERERLPATSKIVLANRENSTEQVMELVHQRAPRGFDDIRDVASTEELQRIGEKYRALTGAELARVNQLAEAAA